MADEIRQFDISPEAIAIAESKGNIASDISSAYQTYLTGSPIGRGGEYAISAQQQYGYASIRDAAAAYLQAAGLNFLPSFESTPSAPTTPVSEPIRTPFEILADVLPTIFGNAQFNQPLRSQTTDYIPFQSAPDRFSAPSAISSSRSNIGSFLILGVIAVIGYFVYKRFKGNG
jgi:hypothetical protein